MSDRTSIRVTIRNRLGLHARPAMSFVDLASTAKSEVRVRRTDSDEVVDGKSIMQVMMRAATQGTELEVTAEGPDASGILGKLKNLVEDGFGEE